MTDSDKIAIANIVMNVIMTGVGWYVMWVIARKTIQATLPTAKPVPKPKRELTDTERRLIKTHRFIQVCVVLFIVFETYSHFVLGGFPPQSRLDKVSTVLFVVAMLSLAAGAISLQSEIRDIESGDFMKRMEQLARERKEREREQQARDESPDNPSAPPEVKK